MRAEQKTRLAGDLFGLEVLGESSGLRLNGITRNLKAQEDASLPFSPHFLSIHRFGPFGGVRHNDSFKAAHCLEPSVRVLCGLPLYLWELNGRRPGGILHERLYRARPQKKNGTRLRAKLSCFVSFY